MQGEVLLFGNMPKGGLGAWRTQSGVQTAKEINKFSILFLSFKQTVTPPILHKYNTGNNMAPLHT